MHRDAGWLLRLYLIDFLTFGLHTDMFRNFSLSFHSSAIKLSELAITYQVPRNCGNEKDCGLNPFSTLL